MNSDLSYIEVLKPGITSIQDAGRFGYMSEGIPVSGFMDNNSAGLANMLVGNKVNEACIEWAMLPPKLKFNNKAVIALTGAEIKVFLNGEIISINTKINVPENGMLSFGNIENGIYGYISIQQGFKTEKVLGSRSWFNQITKHSIFKKGIFIPFLKQKTSTNFNSKLIFKKEFPVYTNLKVRRGPEFNLLTEEQQKSFFKACFTVSEKKNRMGIQLKETFCCHSFNMISSPVLPGTVQWTPSGSLIVLMKDAQTIGGYPRVFQLIENELNRIVNFNNSVRFTMFL